MVLNSAGEGESGERREMRGVWRKEEGVEGTGRAGTGRASTGRAATGSEGTGRDMYIYIYILSYTFIYLYIPSNTPEYLYIPLYTPIYIKISNIRKMGSGIRPQNGHKSGPRGSPMAIFWHAPSYHTP